MHCIAWLSPKRPAQLIVVHVRLRLALAPATRHLVRIDELELAVGAHPRDGRRIRGVGELLEQELPQLHLAGALRDQAMRGGVQQLIGICNKRCDRGILIW